MYVSFDYLKKFDYLKVFPEDFIFCNLIVTDRRRIFNNIQLFLMEIELCIINYIYIYKSLEILKIIILNIEDLI